jgi:hypothetical protein
MATPKPKRRGYALETRTYRGRSGNSYIVHRTRDGTFHVFMEVEAKSAAVDCGSPKTGNTRAQWGALWKRRKKKP